MDVDKKKVWKIIHWVIIIVFIVSIAYGAFQMFFVVGGGGILFFRATTISFEDLVARRLYAIETWVQIVGLAIYLAITEFYPRFKDDIQAVKV